MTAKLFLTTGQEILIDKKDFLLVSEYSWYWSDGYASTNLPKGPIRMHRLILGNPKDKLIDHKNGNKLDNRRSNLRFASKIENARNSKVTSKSSSGFRGICWDKQANKWRVRISTHKGYLLQKLTGSLKEAIQIRNKGVNNFFGKYGRRIPA